VCNECAQNQSAHVYQKNNNFIYMVNSDKTTHRITRRKNAQLLHAQKYDSPFNKFSATVMEKVFRKYITDTL